MTDTQWGAPLTGAQMKLLRVAGLKGRGWQGRQSYLVEYHTFFDNADDYRLPATHPAYTLLEAGWLDGRNVRLWNGGEAAPDDWDGGDVLVNDTHPRIVKGGAVDQHNWSGNKQRAKIIAYTAKDECGHVGYIVELPGIEGFQCSACGKVAGRREVDLARLGLSRSRAPRVEVTADAIDPSKVPPVQRIAPQPETVTIAKMTEVEASAWASEQVVIQPEHPIVMDVLGALGLIKPEPTRAERFTAATGIAATPEILRALEFEQN